MSSIGKYFDKVFCINLDRRPDKWELCVKEFEKAGLTVERISAVDGNDLVLPAGCRITAPEMGCSMSHVKVLRKMLAEGLEKVLILEDDTEFMDDVNVQFDKCIMKVPMNWDMLYLGGNHVRPLAMLNDNNVGRVTRTYTTSHYGISRNMAIKMIPEIEKFQHQVDVTYTKFHATSQCFGLRPPLAWQKPGYSDIQKAHADYIWHMTK